MEKITPILAVTLLLVGYGLASGQQINRTSRFERPQSGFGIVSSPLTSSGWRIPLVSRLTPNAGSAGQDSANYYPYVIARPEDRDWLRNTPIEQRPNRPLHFYGNRVRRGLSR